MVMTAVRPHRILLWFFLFSALGACSVTSLDASTSKALESCDKIQDEQIRADCIVRVAETDPDND